MRVELIGGAQARLMLLANLALSSRPVNPIGWLKTSDEIARFAPFGNLG
jgi:hypothetical protein